MRKLPILLAGVCLTAALYSAGTTYGQNKTNSAKQKEDTVTTNKYQGVTIKDKAKGKVTKQQVRELKKNTPVKMRKISLSGKQKKLSELPLPCGTVVPMEVASNSRDSYPFLTKRLAVRTNQGIFTYAAIPLTGIPFGFSLWNPYTSGAERNV